MNYSELAHLTPVGIILTGALLVVFLDLVIRHEERFVLPWLGAGVCIAAIFSAIQGMGFSGNNWFSLPGSNANVICNGSFVIDGFGVAVWIVACLAGALALLAAPKQSSDDMLATGEYHGLVLLAVSGMMLLAVSHEFMTLLISLEIMSISTYILACGNRNDTRAHEAAVKYLVLGGFSTAIFLMGIAFHYGATGSLSLDISGVMDKFSRPEWAGRTDLLLVGAGLVLAGAMFKIGAAPFQFWVPDVYQGSPSPVTGLMAAGVKAAAFALTARLCYLTYGGALAEKWTPLLEIAAVLTMAVGNIMAMRQSSVKRMLAYSGIAHTGYLLLGLLLRPGEGSVAYESHTRALSFYLLSYSVMTLGAFGVISMARNDGKQLDEIKNFEGLSKTHPGYALCMGLFMFSMAGMPPLGGFFAKFMIFRGAIEQGYSFAATLGILTSVASLFYYMRVVTAMYLPKENLHSHDHEEAPWMRSVAKQSTHSNDHDEATEESVECDSPWNSSLLIYGAGIVTLALGVFPGWILS